MGSVVTAIPAALAAALARPTVDMALAVALHFPSQTVRLWSGFGLLNAGGYVWRGGDILVGWGDIQAAAAGESARLPLKLAGVPGVLMADIWAAVDAGEVLGAEVTIDVVFFGSDGAPVEPLWRQLSGEIVGLDDEPSPPDPKTGAVTWTVTAEVCDEFGMRSASPELYLSQAFLEAIDPDATGLALVPTLFDVTIPFPDFD